jgi:TolB-like protein/DNA-binding winged helix-turn-helix (wHTH) protein/Tfp pilus assembly protein PilF
MSLRPGQFYEFPPFRLDPAEGVLLRDGKMVPLTPKAFRVLQVMVEHHGHIVNKEDLLKQVWPDTFVEEGNLAFNISLLRKALGDMPNAASYIETIPKRGYRFSAPVEVAQPKRSSPASPENRAVVSLGYPTEQQRRWILGFMFVSLALLAALHLTRQRHDAPPPSSRAMLAVLPVQNLTGDPGRDYVSDGLTEEIISQLGMLNPSRLGVIARTSSMTYKNTGKTVAQIGRELGVDYMLESSLRQWGGSVRINAQLIAVRDQTHVWTENYQSERIDILKLQSDVAQAIAHEISFTLTPEQRRRVTSARPLDPQVHELCLLGRYEWNKRTGAGLRKAIECFEQAIERDPQCAPAYAGLADAYAVLPYFSEVSSDEATPKAKVAAEHALHLDETIADAHGVLGFVNTINLDLVTAEREYNRALQLNPNGAKLHHWYSFVLWDTNRREEALAELERARQLDPLSLVINTDYAAILCAAHQTDRAVGLLQKAIELDPNFADAHRTLAIAYSQKGLAVQAISEARRGLALDPNVAEQVTLAYVYAVAGERERARELLAELARRQGISPVYLSFVYAGLGENDHALQCLERAYREHSFMLTNIFTQSMLDRLRADPRFQDLQRRIMVMLQSRN